MSKNTNKRARAAAVALTIVGVAGLSMAAAAQINLNYTGAFQAGATTTINADCQNATVDVKYDTPVFDGSATTPWKVATVTFSKIDTGCQGKKYEAAYKTSGDWVKLTGGTVATGATSVAVPLPASLNANDIKSLALTIYG